jgi:uncharacterized GH25 family protein
VTTRSGPARPPRLLPIAALVLLAGVAPLRAHDFYVIPETAAPGAGATIRLALHVSEVFPGDPVDWRADKTSQFFLQDAKGRLDLKDRVPEGKPLMPRVTLRAPGTTVIALVTEPGYIEIAAAPFQEYLKHEGHADILEMRARMGAASFPGRERYRRYVKTLVNAGGAGSDAALANLSLTIEIIPEAQPASVRPGGSLPVRVLMDGMPYQGGQLCATHAGFSEGHDAYAWCGRLDAQGRAAVPITAAGWQILRTTRMRPLAGDPRADWVSYWSALTFEVPEAR